MKFKVGDRVKKIKFDPSAPPNAHDVPLGAEGTVVGSGGAASSPESIFVWVVYDKYPTDHFTRACASNEWQLEPLTRPGLSAEDEKFVKDLQDALFSQLPDFNPKPRQGEIVQAGDV